MKATGTHNKKLKKQKPKPSSRKAPVRWVSNFTLPEGAKGVESAGDAKTAGRHRPPAAKKLRLQPQAYVLPQPTEKMRRAKQRLLTKIRKGIAASKRGADPDLLGFDNILSVTFGEKIVSGRRSRKPCLVLHVKEKSGSRIQPDAHIDKLHSAKRTGIQTDVIATGDAVACYADGHYRPCLGGASMCSQPVHLGTVACVVSIADPAGGRELCFLGCNHTFAGCATADTTQNAVQLDDWILQPSPFNDGRFPQDAIARLRDFVPLDFSPGGSNKVDCAIAATLPNLKDGRIYGIGSISAEIMDSGLIGRQVAKYGTNTGLRYGIIEDDNAPITISYTQPAPQKANFTQLLKIRPLDGLPFSGPGDSGALIVDVQTRRPVGMVIAADDLYSYGCRIAKVLSSLAARIEPGV